MKRPEDVWNWIAGRVKRQWKTAFLSAFLLGLLIHMPMMLSDIPNHDGLDSLHFDQNMITSGRWFLMAACGISSYYTLPWLIGLLSMLYLAVMNVLLTEFLELEKTGYILLVSGLTVSFPALASNFAYVYTMDGYMLALLLAVAAALAVKKHRLGWIIGAVCLAFSMGIYQAYLSVTVLLCIYGLLMLAMESRPVREKFRAGLHYLWMGILGMAGYYVILRVLLLVQGRELAGYQGISSMGTVERTGLLSIIKKMYGDFFSFTLRGNVLCNNFFSLAALGLLAVLAIAAAVCLCRAGGWWKTPWFYGFLILLVCGVPPAANLILVISPDVNYHLLMRYQWVLFPVLAAAFAARFSGQGQAGRDRFQSLTEWGVLLGAGVLAFNFAVTDNIAYSNLEKRYEKTYAYCVRLLDRIEQTPGYYQGIPIAMIGVVGDDPYPITDITGEVTWGMIGISGDNLLYTGRNYQLFIQNYLGATLNILPVEAMEEMYYSEEYRQMESFPGADSIRIIDGIMYIKTENIDESISEEGLGE